MKAVLIFMVAGSLFVKPSGSIRCYTCNTQVSNSNCKEPQTCAGENACKTDVIGVVGLFNVISKECVSSCTPYFKDFTVGKRNITCCSTDLCNVNGASGFRISYAQVALAVLTSIACFFLRNEL